MTDHDRLRRALADLAAAPPAGGDRATAVAHRIAVRRRARAVGAAALLGTALASGAVAGGAIEPPRAVSFLAVSGDDRRDGAGRDPEPSASASRSMRPSPRRSPSDRPTPRSSSAHASPRPSSRRSHTASPSAGTAHAPLGVRVRVRPTEPTAGQRAIVVVGVRDGDGAVLGVRVVFGDGSEVTRRFEARCDGSRPQPTSRAVEVPHVYDHAGGYVVAATVRTGGCGAEREQREARTRVHVLPRGDSRPSNGGALPVARAQQVRPPEENPAHVAVRVGGADSDGYVTRMVLDWGDGTQPSVVTFPLSECRVADSGYPASRRSTVLRHTYAHRGHYEARLLVVSTGCDGGSEQSARTTTAVNYPMPSPSPRPSPSPSPTHAH